MTGLKTSLPVFILLPTFVNHPLFDGQNNVSLAFRCISYIHANKGNEMPAVRTAVILHYTMYRMYLYVEMNSCHVGLFNKESFCC